MWVCVLLSSYEGSTSVLNGLDPPCDPTQWMTHLPDYQFEQHFIRKATALPQIRALVQSKRFDVFINLCDGAWDEDRAGVEVVKALEMFKVPFTGASSEFYDCSKETMKMVANYEGVKTPAFIFAYDEADVEQAITDLPFKVVVKHFNGYSSVGMTRKSLCGTPEELRVEAARTIGEFGGALIEEFIEGREATVLVAENPADPARPIALLPVECCFPVGETFKHFDLKWNDYGGLQWKPMEDFFSTPRLPPPMASVPPVLWSLCWIALIFFVGWYIAGLCAGVYILISPLAAFIPLVKDLCEILHKGVQLPYEWGHNTRNGTPLF